jgi:hypothetical protein
MRSPRIKLRLALVFGNSSANSKVYLKNIFQVSLKGTSTPVGSNEQKPNTPATPQQNQGTQPKPADKPFEQQK